MKAMIGTGVDPRTLQLLDEIRVLRERVAQLEDALDEAAAVQDAAADTVEVLLDEQVLETTGRR